MAKNKISNLKEVPFIGKQIFISSKSIKKALFNWTKEK